MPGPPRTWSAAIPLAGKNLTDARSSSWPGLSWEAWLLARAGREAPAAPGVAPTAGATGASPGWSLGQPTAPGSAPAAPGVAPTPSATGASPGWSLGRSQRLPAQPRPPPGSPQLRAPPAPPPGGPSGAAHGARLGPGRPRAPP